MMYCANCNKNFDLYDFCPICGAELVKENKLIGESNHKSRNRVDKVTQDAIFNSLRYNTQHYLDEGDKSFEMGNIEEGIRNYDNAITQTTDMNKRSHYFYLKGKKLMENGIIKEALNCFDEGIEADPKNKDNWFEKGKCLYHINCYEDALFCFEKLIRLDHANETFLRYRIECLSELKKYYSALGHCNDALRKRNILSESYKKKFMRKREEIINKINDSSHELRFYERELFLINNEINKLEEESEQSAKEINNESLIEKNLEKVLIEKRINNLKDVIKWKRLIPLLDYLDSYNLSYSSKKILKKGLISEDWDQEKLDEEIRKFIEEEKEEKKETELYRKINNSNLKETNKKRLRKKVKNRTIWNMEELEIQIRSLEKN